MKKIFIAIIGLLCFSRFAYSAPSNSISIPNSFTAGTTIESAKVNENFNEGQSKFNAHTHTDITSLGTVTTGIWSGTVIDEQYGGLGGDFSSKTKGSLLFFNGTGTISSLTPGNSGYILKTQGAGTDPSWVDPTNLTVFNTSTGHDHDGINSKAITLLGAWVSRSNNTVYQAATDGFVSAINLTGAAELFGYTDGSNPPTTLRAHDYGSNAGEGSGFLMPVRKGDYWKTVGAETVWWIPIGS